MRCLKTILVILILGAGLLAQDLRLTASVNRNNITDKDLLTYSVTIEGIRDFPDVPPPESQDFVLISGPSQSSSIQIINGQMSATKTITWQIAPTRTGRLTIPPVTVKYRGKDYATGAVTVNVSGSTSGQSQARSVAPAQSAGSDNRKDEVFLKATVPQTTIYKGAELNVSFDLYYRNVRTFGRKKLPDAQGFWIEEFPAPSQPNITNETVNGVPYRKAMIQQIALFATTTGDLTIDPLVIDCEVVQTNQRRRSVFDDFFDDSFFNDPLFSSTKVVTVQSAPIKIRVKPLPENGQPATFSGAVGKFSIESSIDTLKTRPDQALTLRFKISGSGNINSLQLPPLNLPNSVEVFEPKIAKKIDNKSGEIRGSVTYEYVLIPRRPGLLSIPALTFAYFDPETENYRTLTTRAFNVRVSGNASSPSGPSAGLSKSEISMLGQDIRFIMREPTTWRKPHETVFSQFWFWLLNGAALLIFLGAIGLRWWTDKLESNLTFARRRRAWPKVQARVRVLQERLAGNDTADFYSQLDQALIGYIADRLGLALAGLGPGEIEPALRQRLPDSDLVKATLKLLIRLDEIRFLPDAIADEEPAGMLKNVRELLNNLSKVI